MFETSPTPPGAAPLAADGADVEHAAWEDGEPSPRRLVVRRSRAVPPFSQATWGLATHALAASLRRDGGDADGGWRTTDDGAPVRAHLDVAPHPEGVRVTLSLDRVVLGSEMWALPLLLWPFAFLLSLMVGRGDLPWAFWIVPALFALAPAFLLGLRWASHRAWAAVARRHARRALDAFADAVAEGNALEASPAARLFVPADGDAAHAARRAMTVEDDAWDAPFVAPEVSGAEALEQWFSLDEVETLGADLRAGRLGLRAAARAERLAPSGVGMPTGDGARVETPPVGDGVRLDAAEPSLEIVPSAGTMRGARPTVRRVEAGASPQPGRVRRRPASPPRSAGWVQRTLGSGFGEWLPESEPSASRLAEPGHRL